MESPGRQDCFLHFANFSKILQVCVLAQEDRRTGGQEDRSQVDIAMAITVGQEEMGMARTGGHEDRRTRGWPGRGDLVKLRKEEGEAGGQEAGGQQEGVAHSHPFSMKEKV